MNKILLVGNPNVGKSTLFNSLTRSNEHTGNFHGVTVNLAKKSIGFEGGKYDIFDLPGLYSLNTFSDEEIVSKKEILKGNSIIEILCDANTLRKNLYLCIQLSELNFSYNLLINNHEKYLKKNGNKIDINKLQKNLKRNVYLINAKKEKFNNKYLKTQNQINKKIEKYLLKYIEIVQKRYNFSKNRIIFALNGVFDGLNDEQIEFVKSLFSSIIQDRYKLIDEILNDAITEGNNKIYGYSIYDKFLLNPVIAIIGFLAIFFLGFYLIFFILGPLISRLEEIVFINILIEPIMNFEFLLKF